MKLLFSLFIALIIFAGNMAAQTTTFTYQGRLTDSSLAANGTFDMQFKLFDAASGGAQLGATITNATVSVTNGIFTVQLNAAGEFGATAFTGADRYLEVSVRHTGDPGYTTLLPRHQVTSAPYAARSSTAGSAQFLKFVDNRTIAPASSNHGQMQYGFTSFSNNNTSPWADYFLLNSFTDASGGNDNLLTFSRSSIAARLWQQAYNSGAAFSSFKDFAFKQDGLSQFSNDTGFHTGSGTLNRVAKYTGANTMGNSQITDDGNVIVISPPTYTNFTTGTVYIQSGLVARSGITNDGGTLSLNGSNGITNFGNYLQGNGKYAIDVTDAWLRLNQQGSFTNGIFTPGFFRADGGIASGSVSSLGSGTIIASGVIRGNGFQDASGNSVIDAGGGWHRSYGNTGWYNQTYGGGWYMIDSTWIRSYPENNTRHVYMSGGFDTNSPSGVGCGGGLGGGSTFQVCGTMEVSTLGSGPGTTLCRNASAQLSNCSSSIRYKKDIHNFSSGLNLIDRLRPVYFNWKANNEADMGLVAEEVATVEPLLVTHNDKGEIEGVKYDRVGVVLINAVKEQQAEIEKLKQQVETLKKLVCAGNPAAEACKGKE